MFRNKMIQKNNLKIISLLLSTLIFSSVAHSAVLFEPVLGYRMEKMTLTSIANSETKFSSANPAFGLRFGYQSPLGIELNLAGDYSAGKMQIDPIDVKNDFSHTTVAAQLGISAMGLFKIYLGYGFMNEFQLKDSAQYTGFKLKGTAYQAGIQFKLFPYVSLGAQYNINDYKEIEGSGYVLGNSTSTYFNKIDVQDYILQAIISF